MMSVAELVEALEQEREDHALTAWVLANAVDSQTDDHELAVHDARFNVCNGVGVLSLGWEDPVDAQRLSWRRVRRAVQQSRREFRK